MTKKCSNCVFAWMRDYGYSDYTVEGTEINCALDLNPGFPTDRFYFESKELLFAEQCPKFEEGDIIDHLNVDILDLELEEHEKLLDKIRQSQAIV